MNLYLMRHGKAESVFEGDDAARKLTKKGVKQIKSAAKLLAGMEIDPAQIFASPRVRAHETAAIVAEKLNKTVEIRDEVNFDFNVDAIWNLTADLSADDDAMFVGHNPSMTEVVSYLTGARLELRPGAVACVMIPRPGSVNGILRWLLSPDMYF